MSFYRNFHLPNLKVPEFKIPEFKIPENGEDLQKLVDKLVEEIIAVAPTVEHYFMEAVEAIFAPKQTVRLLLIGVALQSTIVLSHGVATFFSELIEGFTATGRERKRIMARMASATNFDAWKLAAMELDKLNRVDVWRGIDECSFYDHRLIRTRINDINAMMRRGDTFNLMFKCRGGLSRDQFGIQHGALFSKAAAGTKELVEEYHETISQALEFIADSPSSDDVIP